MRARQHVRRTARPNGKVYVELDNWGSNYNFLISTVAVNDGAFHHVAIVRKATSASLYVDGRVQVTKSTAGVTNITNGADLIAGKSRCTGVDGTRHLTGLLDEIVIGPDRDTDGRPNVVDNCPGIANAVQEDGDGDGTGDACQAPAPPTLTNLAPTDGASSVTAAPTLSATYDDPNPGDDGHVEFEVYRDGSLVASNAGTSPTVVLPGQTATWQVPEGSLQGGRTYTWRARAFEGVNYSQWTSNPAARSITIGGTYPTIEQWTADQDTGRVDYTYRVSAAGLNAPGQLAGPCYQLDCSWRVEARYSDGTVQRGLGTIASGALAHNTASMNETLTGVLAMEVTDIRTIVDPGACYGCVQGRTRYDSGWIKVATPYRSGNISLSVNSWRRDTDSGVITYDLTVSASGASQIGGPCEEKGCQWRIDALHADGATTRLASENLPGGKWSFTSAATGTTSGSITHVKATLDSTCGVNNEYWCWNPWETYATGWIAVSDYIFKNQDLAAAGVALEPVLLQNTTFFCERFLARGTHHFGSTVTDQYLACDLAVRAAPYGIYKALEAIVGAPGPARIGDFDPEPFPLPDLTIPAVRTDWEDETGCAQDIPEWSIELVEGKIEFRHGYQSLERASKWAEDAPWRLLVRPHAMRSKAQQGTRPDRCERVIDYDHPVGYEYHSISDEYTLTTTYTVVTVTATGALVTAHPGRPGEDQDR